MTVSPTGKPVASKTIDLPATFPADLATLASFANETSWQIDQSTHRGQIVLRARPAWASVQELLLWIANGQLQARITAIDLVAPLSAYLTPASRTELVHDAMQLLSDMPEGLRGLCRRNVAEWNCTTASRR